MSARNGFAITLAILVAGCTSQDVRDADTGAGDASAVMTPGAPAALASPAGPGSGEPFLSATRAGTVLMSWFERTDSTHMLRFAELTGDSWSEPRTIVEASTFFVNWADFPSIIELSDGRLATHWLQRSGPGTYSYDTWIAFSSDRGATWSEPVRPHEDGTETEHGFATLFELDGMPAAVWLDGRQNAEVDGRPGAGQMSVRFALLDAAGMPTGGTEIDGRTCDCCQTDVAITSNGPAVVYRDRTADEIRDIVISRRVNGAWTEPAKVHDDQWHINACPVNGPAIAAVGDRVAVAWFTAASDTARVFVAFSSDAGATFGEPVRIDSGAPSGRVDLMLLNENTALVSWLERVDQAAHVLVRTVSTNTAMNGGPGEIITVGGSSPERGSGFPRMVRTHDRVVFAWTVPGRPSSIEVAALSLMK